MKNNPLPKKGKKLLIWVVRVLACGIPGLLLGLELVGLVFGSLRLNWGAFLFQILIPALVLLRLILLFRSSRSSALPSWESRLSDSQRCSNARISS